jgi:hypothetical protein
MLKGMNDIYLRGSRNEEIPNEQFLLRTLVDVLGNEIAAELLSKIKTIFKRRRNDALSQLPKRIRSALPAEICYELQNNVVEVLSPKSHNTKEIKSVMSHLGEKKIGYATIYENEVENEGGEKTISYKLVRDKTAINATPTDITRYEANNVCEADTILKYNIKFESNLGDELIHFETGPSTIEEILTLLRANGYIYNFKIAEGLLTAILNACHREGRMKVESQLKSGFYLIDGKVQAYGYIQQKPKDQDIVECINLLNDLANRYSRPEIFSSVIKWGMIAPFGYVLKQLDDKTLCLELKYDYGETHAGKTTNGQIVLCIWRIRDLDHEKPFNSVNNESRMGYAISESTFPMLINEVPDLSDTKKYGDLVEAIKNSVYDKTFRSRVEGARFNKYRHFPALRQFYFTGNPSPLDDTAFQRRIFPTYYSQNDVPADKKDFEILLNKQGYKLGILGDFVANFILNDNECLKTNWRQLTTEILTAFYREAGFEAPNWVKLLSAEDHLEDVIEAQKQVVMGTLRNLIEECHSRTYHSLKNSFESHNGNRVYEQNDTFQKRLNFCFEKDSISFLKKKGDKIYILQDVVKELKRCKVEYISGLPQLQSMIGGHSKYLPLKVGERKQKVITVDFNEFLISVNPLNYIGDEPPQPPPKQQTLKEESWNNKPKSR